MRLLVLAMVLTITLAVATPALADDIATASPIPGYPDYEITDKGLLVYQRDVIVGKCGSSPERFAFQSASLRKEAARACEKAGYPASLANTGGLPVILVPISLLVVGGSLIRNFAAL